MRSAENLIPSLGGATGWINSPALELPRLRGKVVVVEFWTYSCINWLRQLPYVRAWAERYRADGLVVIGVHTPEFTFERDADRVREAVRAMAIDYPVAIDSDRTIWGSFDNRYWPALYFFDAQGRLRHSQFGEGEYAASERMIRQLLAEAGNAPEADLAVVEGKGIEAPADWRNLQSAETYVGYGRPLDREESQWSLEGNWANRSESIVLEAEGGRIVYRFHARDLHVVMGATRNGARVRFIVRIDGKVPGESHGLDIDASGRGTVTTPRLYQLIRQPGAIRDRELEIEFIDQGAEVFTFTFG
jgi:thiol-disulfide isomerase/thioredoxin